MGDFRAGGREPGKGDEDIEFESEKAKNNTGGATKVQRMTLKVKGEKAENEGKQPSGPSTDKVP